MVMEKFNAQLFSLQSRPLVPPPSVVCQGVVYWYTNQNKAAKRDYGKKYVGYTFDEKRRRECWNSYPSDYAGPKINAARRRTPKEKWEYNRIILWDVYPERLAYRLSLLESVYIAHFDSYLSGFNNNTGGPGPARTTIIKTTSSSGEVRFFRGYRAAAEAFGLTTGGVQRYVDKNANHTNKDGYVFEKLTNNKLNEYAYL